MTLKCSWRLCLGTLLHLLCSWPWTRCGYLGLYYYHLFHVLQVLRKYDAAKQLVVAALYLWSAVNSVILKKAYDFFWTKMVWLSAAAAGMTELGPKAHRSKLCRELSKKCNPPSHWTSRMIWELSFTHFNTTLGGFVGPIFFPEPTRNAAVMRGIFWDWDVSNVRVCVFDALWCGSSGRGT